MILRSTEAIKMSLMICWDPPTQPSHHPKLFGPSQLGTGTGIYGDGRGCNGDLRFIYEILHRPEWVGNYSASFVIKRGHPAIPGPVFEANQLTLPIRSVQDFAHQPYGVYGCISGSGPQVGGNSACFFNCMAWICHHLDNALASQTMRMRTKIGAFQSASEAVTIGTQQHVAARGNSGPQGPGPWARFRLSCSPPRRHVGVHVGARRWGRRWEPRGHTLGCTLGPLVVHVGPLSRWARTRAPGPETQAFGPGPGPRKK